MLKWCFWSNACLCLLHFLFPLFSKVLIPQVVDVCKGRMSPLFGTQVQVIAAGGIFDGRGALRLLLIWPTRWS